MDALDEILREQEPPKLSEGIARGGLQGMSLGWSDELAARASAALPRWARNRVDEAAVGGGKTYGERFQNALKFYRERNRAAQQAYPVGYGASEVAGGLVPVAVGTAATGGAAALPLAVGQGAISGVGYGEDDQSRLASAGVGAGLGVLGYGVGKTLAGPLQKLAKGAGRKVAGAVGKARQQAGEQAAEEVASLAGKYGTARQQSSRATEVLLRAERAGMLTPEAQAAVQAAKASPEFQQVLSNVAKNYAEDIPGLLGKDIAAKGAMTAAQAALPETVKRLATEKATPQFGKDIKSLLKSYGEPVLAAAAGGYLGSELGGPEGAAAGSLGAGLIFGRTRAGKAIMSRLQRPGNQAAMFKAAGRATKGLSRLVPQAGTAAGFTLGEPLMSYVQGRGKRSDTEAALDDLLLEE